MRVSDCGLRNDGSMRLLIASALLFLFVLPAYSVEDEPNEYRTETLRGRVVFLAEVLEKHSGIRAVPEARERILALQTADGTLIPLLEDARGRAFRRDERLREMNVELVVRRYEKNPLAQIIRVMEVTKDGRYEIDYWCDICAIATVEKKDCECCQGPVELRRRKVDQ